MRMNLCALIVVVLAPLAWPALAEDGTEARQSLKAASATVSAQNSHGPSGIQALENASQHGKYAFLFLFRNEDARTEQLRTLFDGAVSKIADRAESFAVRVDDPAEQDIVNRFKVSRAPMPMVFSIAPNGAVIQSFGQKFTEQQLVDAFASPGMEACLKALQDRKYVLLCAQNGETQFNDEAMKGVQDFVADPRYARSIEIVTVDPSNEQEVDFLARFGLTSSPQEAVTLLLAPPGRVVGTFTGATDKNTLLAAVTPRKSGCGCGGGSGKSTCGK